MQDNSEKRAPVHWFDKQAEQLETSRFGAMPLMMVAQSCIGSVAGPMAEGPHSLMALACSAVITMACNAGFLSMAPAKWCLVLFYLSVGVNSLIIIAILIGIL